MPSQPSYHIHNGFRLPMGFPPEGFKSALYYQPQKDDIFVVTYPKCGTTWTQYIIWLLYHQGQPLLPHQKLDQVFPHLEEVGGEFINQLSYPRFIKTHLPYELTPYSQQSKYIYVARNPFDCVVSFYHHTRGFIKHYNFAQGTFDDFFECFMKGEVDFGDYFNHLLGWYQQRDKPNFLFLTYEQMQADLKTTIYTIAEFLGQPFLKNAQNSTVLDKIIEESHLSKMQINPQRWSSQRPDNMPPFIRKGQVGDWKNYFSSQQEKRLKEKFDQKMQGTDLQELGLGY